MATPAAPEPALTAQWQCLAAASAVICYRPTGILPFGLAFLAFLGRSVAAVCRGENGSVVEDCGRSKSGRKKLSAALHIGARRRAGGFDDLKIAPPNSGRINDVCDRPIEA